ncbi:glycosyltransferase family 4 protein [Rhizobium terrae]|uniref:glycosyltransferase family 4 protein n=1 Tax=Rhizobium terrae TaxID=2171756 RepID=UPI000E3D5853|nr:glycosyltransferase family 4 protein [Rhizobium terrae]
MQKTFAEHPLGLTGDHITQLRPGTPDVADEDNISDFVAIPDDAAQSLRTRLGLQPSQTPRVAFIAGPGDVAGTFDHWIEGRFDPRTPVVAYSTMFYTLIEKLQAMALLIAEPENLPKHRDPRFRFVSIPRARPSGSLSYRKASFTFSRKVVRELHEYQPHVLLMGVDTPWWVVSSIPRNTKIVLTAHNNFWPMGLEPKSIKDRLKRRMTSLSIRRVEAGVCTSEETRRQVVELAGGKAERFYAEVPQLLSKFLASPRQSDQLRDILFLGRLQEEKGIFDLLAAFENTAARYPHITLAFAGAGEAEAELRRRIAASSFSGRIRMLGQLNADDVHQQLAQTDLLACPTRSTFPEGLALVVVEAAAHGVPSILSSVVPAKELVAGACIEFPADDVRAFSSALNLLASDTRKLHELRTTLIQDRQKFFDRSLSWGTKLYSAFVA